MGTFNLPILAREASCWIGEALTVNATSTLGSQIQVASKYADFTATVKDVSISGGGRDVDLINLLGLNQLLEEKRPEIVEISFTRVAGADIGAAAPISGFEWSDGSAIAAPTNKRVQLGEKASNDRTKKSVAVYISNNSLTLTFLATNAYVQTPELSLSADGSMEEKFTIKAKANDCYIEDSQS
jgi:hypothetical protein